MTVSAPAPKPRVLSARRLVLLASVAGLGAAVLFGGADFLPKASGPALSTIAYAQGVQRPMGFADIVDKVKPAVISVKVTRWVRDSASLAASAMCQAIASPSRSGSVAR